MTKRHVRPLAQPGTIDAKSVIYRWENRRESRLSPVVTIEVVRFSRPYGTLVASSRYPHS
jgi:hypothetical protein